MCSIKMCIELGKAWLGSDCTGVELSVVFHHKVWLYMRSWVDSDIMPL